MAAEIRRETLLTALHALIRDSVFFFLFASDAIFKKKVIDSRRLF